MVQTVGCWLIFGPLVIAGQHRHENLGLDLLLPGSLVAAMGLMGTGMPERQVLQLGSLIILVVNSLLALGLWHLALRRAERDA